MMTFEEAKGCITFNLTYARSPHRRLWTPSGITGPDIDHAQDKNRDASGGWGEPDWPSIFTDDVDWEFLFFQSAIAEGVHEACEWLQVDGRPLIDPHGALELEVSALAGTLARDLYARQARLA